jgi:hypothetical protein
MTTETNWLVVKWFLFGLAMPLIVRPLTTRIADWIAWGIAATIAVLLFQWLPPQVHPGLTVGRSLGISLAAGAAAAVAVFLVEKLP